MLFLKFLSLPITLLVLSLPAFAQRQITGNKLKDHLYYGGNFGVSFSSNYTYVQASPRIGYMITNNFSAGLGATYILLSSKLLGGNTSVYGGNTFARYNLFKNFFAQTEFEVLNTRYALVNRLTGEVKAQRGWVPGWFIGGGIFQPFGARGGVTLAGYYNLLYDNVKSPYNSPFIVSAGINF